MSKAQKSQVNPTAGFNPLLGTIPLFEIRYLIGALRGSEERNLNASLHAFTNVQSFVVFQINESDDDVPERFSEKPPVDQWSDEELANALEMLPGIGELENKALSLFQTNGVWWQDLLEVIATRLLDRLLKRATQ